MKNYFLHNDWKIIEKGFDPEMHESAESIFSIGNGKMGQRGMFEEKYTGKSLQGSYIAGVYYPDKTRVGWWKNGYPEYFAKVLNSPNWIGMDIQIDGESIDLFKHKPEKFERVLDMQQALLSRTFQYIQGNKKFEISAERFNSRADDELACIRYEITATENASILWNTGIDAKVKNKDSNYDELFWSRISEHHDTEKAWLKTKTNKLGFEVCEGFYVKVYIDGVEQTTVQYNSSEWNVGATWKINVEAGKTYRLEKYVSIVSSMYYNSTELEKACLHNLSLAKSSGYTKLKENHVNSWAEVWRNADIRIEGDTAAQQGIRFNIFQLNQTYTGRDPRLNIGPKGFTGEKYGGSTYWDTEAYCIPFYLGTSDSSIALQLLKYRYNQLDKAIENAAKLGFTNGAALYPMVTMNGEECHNEWEITFEEIHRNGAIAYAIYQYTLYTADESYLVDGGAEVLLGIARFWAQRIHWSDAKKKFVMHGVTGPNEYENNVNNNWYTNYIACWCMKYTSEVIDKIQKENTSYFIDFVTKTSFNTDELIQWKKIVENMYYPIDNESGVILQQEGYLDKEQKMATDLLASERPINQHWSWDRILRSCFIKQADVLQGLFLFEDHFDTATLKKNFDFYEPRTVHESSLSPCIHVVQAAKLGYEEKAYELYLRTSRLDLDDYNKEAQEGLHITSMAGTWMAVVMGFGGLRIKENRLSFSPMLPKQWTSFQFCVRYREAIITININKETVNIKVQASSDLVCELYDEQLNLSPNKEHVFSIKSTYAN
jgi:maltose phosphorylase